MTEMEITLNGAPHRLPEGSRVQDLVVALQLGQQAIAVAVNRQIVPRSQWQERSLQAQDQVDVVRAIGGG
jgi:sulfur carrier protein